VERSWSKVEAAPGLKELREKGFYCSSSGPRSRLWEIGYRAVRNGQDDYWGPEKMERMRGGYEEVCEKDAVLFRLYRLLHALGGDR
jgi:hypothetical protein